MKSLTKELQEKKNRGEKLFIPYIMAGANGLDRLPEEINLLAECGASAIELGIPFSDPVADGPVIQQAGLDAFTHQVTLAKIIQVLQQLESPVSLILMGYANSFFHYGLEKLMKDLASTAVRGLIIPDLPYEHRDLVQPFLVDQDIALIQLVSLTSTEKRIDTLLQAGEGFIYAVTVNGTTGVGQAYQDSLDAHLQALTMRSPIPVLAGFGIGTRAQVERFSESCDGVIVGSKIVSSLKNQGLVETRHLVQKLIGNKSLVK